MATAVTSTEFRPPAKTAQRRSCSGHTVPQCHCPACCMPVTLTSDYGLINSTLCMRGCSRLQSPPHRPPYERELTSHLRESRLPRSTDIYAFWHWNQYTCLTPAAHKYLSAPPTSVASEQLFSAARQLYADRRSNLQGSNYFAF